MNLKQAILSLPKIDKQWVTGGKFGEKGEWAELVVNGKSRCLLYVKEPNVNELHKAAVAIDMEIRWAPCIMKNGKQGYIGLGTTRANAFTTIDDWMETSVMKSVEEALQVAFASAVEYRINEIKDARN